ncbi:hypothetical protein EUX98_g8909 [Antrodiella citrinella]|uniref:Uncharacterized protein n=1 Tax=Antrodiella citrinella TaxID=2447956 RepID=A0A4S4M131_9APHY|nr:hypothetical protein EUX98_g8909 [Antrodiella citrinella]
MSTAFYSAASYKPQVLSRTEGFHLPSPAPSTPPSSESTPAGSNNNFDTNNLFISPPSYLSVPETFRKFPGPSPDSSSSMDFTEELASLISNPASASSGHHHHHPSSHERSTHSPANAYDDYRPHTHNIFDISAPTHHSHHTSSHQQQYASASSAFSLPPSTSIHHHGSIHGHHAASLHNHSSQPHPLHDFAPHSHFNSTVPAIGSSMRYEPPGSSHGGEPSSVSSFNSHMSGMSNFSNITTTSDSYHNNGGMRQTPSPVGGNGGAQEGFAGSNRSRSRSRASANGAAAPVDPP